MADWENLDSELDVENRKAVLNMTMTKPEHRGLYSCSLWVDEGARFYQVQSFDKTPSFLHVQSKRLKLALYIALILEANYHSIVPSWATGWGNGPATQKVSLTLMNV